MNQAVLSPVEAAESLSDWDLHAQMYAFLGNSFLSPMNEELSVGLLDSFWGGFACDGYNEHVCNGIKKIVTYVQGLDGIPHDAAMQKVNLEYAHLFIGPPKPAAIVWESMAHGSHVGFGNPTFEMREILRNAGLTMAGPHNQYEDHMGIELMFVASRCQAFAQHIPSLDEECSLREFIEAHPLAWAQTFHESIAAASPGGYYDGLSELTWGLLLAEV